MYLNQTDLINRNIRIGAITSNSEALKQLIKDDRESDYKKDMQDGENYFLVKNTKIMNTEMNVYYTYVNKGTETNPIMTLTKKVNPQSANIKKPSSIYRTSVNQKMHYGLGNGIGIEHPTSQEDILNVLEDKDNKIKLLAQNGSNYAVSYIYCFIDEFGKFGYTVMDSREIIAIYKDDARTKIDKIIRYYNLILIQDGEKQKRLRVEIYHSDRIEVMDENESGVLYVNENLSTAYGLINNVDSDKNEVISTVDWGRPPFVEYVNNPERITDLQAAKHKIDDVDYQDSKLSNDYTDKPENLITLKDYEGENPADAMDRFKVTGMALTAGEGGIDSVDLSIPYQGKQSVIKETKKDIFTALAAVDTSAETVSKAPSGIALEMLYTPLDIKVTDMYTALEKSLKDLMYFVNEYFKLTGKLTNVKKIKPFDINETKFIFTPKKVKDLSLIADIVLKLSALLPPEEYLKLLPFIKQEDIEGIINKMNEIPSDIFNQDMPVNDTSK